MAIDMLSVIKKEFAKEIGNDRRIKMFLSRVRNKTATFQDAHEYSRTLGEILSKIVIKNAKDIDVDEFKEICDSILEPMLKQNHELVVSGAKSVQDINDKNDDISLGAVKPKMDNDHKNKIIENITNSESENGLIRAVQDGIENFTESALDRFMKENVSFRFDTGLKGQVIRIYEGPHREHTDRKGGGEMVDCEWCKSMARIFDYGDIPPEAWGRHEGCHCTIIYRNHKQKHHENMNTGEIF